MVLGPAFSIDPPFAALWVIQGSNWVLWLFHLRVAVEVLFCLLKLSDEDFVLIQVLIMSFLTSKLLLRHHIDTLTKRTIYIYIHIHTLTKEKASLLFFPPCSKR